MAKEEGYARILRAFKGAVAASAVTLLGMVFLALSVVYLGLNPEKLAWINQLLKAASILLGVLAAVGIGGEKGLVTGAVVGSMYIIVGYAFYCLIDGSEASAGVMATETAAGAVIGALSGIAFANIRPGARRRA